MTGMIYVRTQLEYEEILDYQFSQLKKLADDLEINVEEVIYDIAYDFTEHDSVLDTLISDISKGFIDCILVWSLDRITTDPSQKEEIEILCEMHNVKIIEYKNSDCYG